MLINTTVNGGQQFIQTGQNKYTPKNKRNNCLDRNY